MTQVSMTVRLAKEKKEIFDKLCEAFGMSANTAVNLFVNAVVRKQAIPFAIAIDDRDDACESTVADRGIRELLPHPPASSPKGAA